MIAWFVDAMDQPYFLQVEGIGIDLFEIGAAFAGELPRPLEMAMPLLVELRGQQIFHVFNFWPFVAYYSDKG